jgi:hypothetical protein
MNRRLGVVLSCVVATACGQAESVPGLSEAVQSGPSSVPSGDLVIAYQTNLEGEIEPCG